MGENRGWARQALREEERGANGAGATRGEVGAPDDRHGAGAVEAGAGWAMREQGRRGPGRVGPSWKREGECVGQTWKMWAGRGEGNWVGPEETVNVLIYLNNFLTNLNCFDQNVDLPSSKIYK
jgi:hypothetical protein